MFTEDVSSASVYILFLLDFCVCLATICPWDVFCFCFFAGVWGLFLGVWGCDVVLDGCLFCTSARGEY